jgi:hypothetical protein
MVGEDGTGPERTGPERSGPDRSGPGAHAPAGDQRGRRPNRAAPGRIPTFGLRAGQGGGLVTPVM